MSDPRCHVILDVIAKQAIFAMHVPRRKKAIVRPLSPTILMVRHFEARKGEPAFAAVSLRDYDLLMAAYQRLRAQIREAKS